MVGKPTNRNESGPLLLSATAPKLFFFFFSRFSAHLPSTLMDNPGLWDMTLCEHVRICGEDGAARHAGTLLLFLFFNGGVCRHGHKSIILEGKCASRDYPFHRPYTLSVTLDTLLFFLL